MDDETLKKLLTRVTSGDIEAFELILSFYEKSIFNHLLRLLGDRDEASDLLQETFIHLYKNRANIDTDSNFKNWLYKIATNIAFDHFRKKKREKSISLDDESASETFETGLSYSNLEQEIAEHDLKAALEGLRPNYRNILLLYYREQFSYDEIADILKLPVNTVKTHLRRARGELASLLKETYG
jgi:RNA polymerase sigma-70 factor (ECF subfamily)